MRPRHISECITELLTCDNAFSRYCALSASKEVARLITQEMITQNQAFLRFGRRAVERWANEGKIKRHWLADNNRVYYKQSELIELSRKELPW